MTPEEITASLDEAVDDGAIEAQEHQVVSNVFSLDERPLTSFMTPRADAVWLDAHLTVEQALQDVKAKPLHSWYPIVKGSLEHVVGVIPLATLIQHEDRSQTLEALADPPMFLPETLTGLDLLTKLRAQEEGHAQAGRHGLIRLACVVDEYGEVQGLVTPGDLLEAITGELQSTSQDDLIWAVQRDDGSWLLDGLMPLQELRQRLELETLPDEDLGHYNTLAGFILYVMGRLPVEGQHVRWMNWRFEIVDMDGRRIDKVLATTLGDPPESA